VSETPAETTAADPAPAEHPDTLAELTAKVDKIFDILAARGDGGGGSESEPEPEPDVKAETRNAVAEVRRREAARRKRAEEKAASEARLAAVEEKVKEKPPREYRRVENWMGWADKEQ